MKTKPEVTQGESDEDDAQKCEEDEGGSLLTEKWIIRLEWER